MQKDESMIKHAFILSFFWLLQAKHYLNDLEKLYITALEETIKLGGDADSNATVVGGMIGALVGVKRIPQSMVTKLLTFDDYVNGQRRDEFLNMRLHLIRNVD